MKYQIYLVSFCILYYAIPIAAQVQDSIIQQATDLIDDIETDISSYKESLSLVGASTVISAEEILERGYDNLDELVSSVQGMYLNHDRTATQMGVRGISPTTSNNERLLILLDDIPLNNPISGQALSGYELRGIAMEDIEEVVIIRNPMSVVHGNGAMLGMIKIKTKKRLKGLRLNMDVGSFGELDGGFALGQEWGETTLRISGRSASILGQDLYIPDFFEFLPQADESDFDGLQLQLNRGKVSFKGAYNQRSGKISNAPYESVLFSGDNQYQERQVLADLSFNGTINDQQSVFAHLFVNYNQSEIAVLHAIDPDPIDEFRTQESLAIGLGYQHQFDFQPGHQLLLGTSFWQVPRATHELKYIEFGSTISEETTTLDSELYTFGLFAHDTYRLNEKLTLSGGLRVEVNPITELVLAPQIAMLYQGGPTTTFRLGYSRGYRLPSLLETFVDQDFFPSSNPNLLPEYINSLELAWKQDLGDFLDLNIAFYRQDLDGLIPFGMQYINGLSIETYGLEGSLAVELPKHIKTYFNYNFQFDGGKTVNLPSPLCKFGVTVPFLKHFSFFTEGQYEGPRLTFDNQRTTSFFLLNTNLLFRPRIESGGKMAKFINKSNFSVRVYNLLDEFYQHPGGQLISLPLVQQNGRTWQSQLTLQF